MGDRESAETLVKTMLGGAGSGDALSASMSSTREDIRALKSIILNGGQKSTTSGSIRQSMITVW